MIFINALLDVLNIIAFRKNLLKNDRFAQRNTQVQTLQKWNVAYCTLGNSGWMVGQKMSLCIVLPASCYNDPCPLFLQTSTVELALRPDSQSTWKSFMFKVASMGFKAESKSSDEDPNWSFDVSMSIGFAMPLPFSSSVNFCFSNEGLVRKMKSQNAL